MIYTVGVDDKAIPVKQAYVGVTRHFNDRNIVITLPVDKEEIQKGKAEEETPVEGE